MVLRAFTKSFGRDVQDWPVRFSNVKWERLRSGAKVGCSDCFPHGIETTNAQWVKDLRCWKRYRKQQWRERDCGASHNHSPSRV